MIEFLRQVWTDGSGYVFLPTKGARWSEGKAYKWPDDEGDIIRHIEASRDKDLYYCPNLFSLPSRKQENVQNPRWLYADLDNVNPNKIDLRPNIAIQSSPGRFQALWRLARPLDPVKHMDYNRRLTYAVGADRGGWDLTQVLRVPGTRNYKYPGRVSVRLSWSEPGSLTLAKARRFLDGVEANLDRLPPDLSLDILLPAESASQIRQRVWSHLDRRTQTLLASSTVPLDSGPEGRSGVLWELECRLLESGLSPEEAFVVVKDSVWNKFADRRDGDAVLWKEVQKANLHTGTPITVDPSLNGFTRTRPRLLTYADLLGSGIREPDWAIDGWWTLGSHGVVAGLPKSFKSLVTLDMAVSLASESPFLGLYDTNPKACGPVLVIQQENSLALLRDRLLKISHGRGLQIGASSIEDDNTIIFQSPPNIPILFYNDFGFDMTLPDDREAVEVLIRQEGVKTVIFDPLYLMIGGADENVAKEMRPILQWLLRIRNLYNTAVVVVHHWGKQTPGHGGRGVGGTRLLGSTTIYGWLEAALYLEAKHHDTGVQVIIEREFRERPSPPPISFGLHLGDIGETEYEWDTESKLGFVNAVVEAINRAGPTGATIAWIRSECDIGQKKARQEIDALVEGGIAYEKPVGRQKRVFLTSYSTSEDE